MEAKRIPEGPDGEDIPSCSVTFHRGSIRLETGDVVEIGGSQTVLRKIRRLHNGEIYGMVEYPDGGFLWTGLVPIPVPELSRAQAEEIARIRESIPRQFWVLGDMSRKVGDRTSIGGKDGTRSGTIIFMAATRPFTAGSVIAMDDASLSIGDDVMALLDGRIETAHESVER